MSPTDYDGVLSEWDRPEREADIHPSWKKGVPADMQDEYWESGWTQAQDVVDVAKEGDRVLDFGAGNGRLTIPLAKLGFETWAADASREMLAKLEANAKGAGVNVRTVHSDGTDLAKHLGRKRAEVVVCRAVLIHHDYEGVEKIVTNLAGVLRKGGHLIADWPTGTPQVRDSYIGVTVWDAAHRDRVARGAGLTPVKVHEQPTVWRKV